MPVQIDFIQRNTIFGSRARLRVPSSAHNAQRRLAHRRRARFVAQPAQKENSNNRFGYLPKLYTDAADQAFKAVSASLRSSLEREPTLQETALVMAQAFGVSSGAYIHSGPHKHQIDALTRIQERACDVTRRSHRLAFSAP